MIHPSASLPSDRSVKSPPVIFAGVPAKMEPFLRETRAGRQTVSNIIVYSKVIIWTLIHLKSVPVAGSDLAL